MDTPKTYPDLIQTRFHMSTAATQYTDVLPTKFSSSDLSMMHDITSLQEHPCFRSLASLFCWLPGMALGHAGANPSG